MRTLKSDSDIRSLLDQPSYGCIIDLMIRDCRAYSEKFGTRENEWIPRIIVARGSDHPGSKVPFGFLLHYQFCRLPICYDLGICEIRLADSMDDFLDLYNEIRLAPAIKNKQKGE